MSAESKTAHQTARGMFSWLSLAKTSSALLLRNADGIYFAAARHVRGRNCSRGEQPIFAFARILLERDLVYARRQLSRLELYQVARGSARGVDHTAGHRTELAGV